jgi:hypothetical protein
MDMGLFDLMLSGTKIAAVVAVVVAVIGIGGVIFALSGSPPEAAGSDDGAEDE